MGARGHRDTEGEWTAGAAAFWENRALLLALVLLASVPILLTDVPPLVDLPSHMGRYRVQLAIDSSPFLARYYGFEWALIGNLGVDLLIIPLAKLFGLELGVKLIVATIPALTVAGLLLVAKAVHGRIPSTAFFALPVAYSYPLQFGFVNFALSVAFALLAFALWVRLGRLEKPNLRALIFIPLSCIIWVTHTFGWGLLGVLAFAAETVAAREKGASHVQAIFRGAMGCLPLTPPIMLMMLWRSGAVSGFTGDWFNWTRKFRYLVMALREQLFAWDLFSVALLVALPLLGLKRFQIAYDRTMALAFVCLVIIYILLPRIMFGSAYADMRLAPFMLAAGVLMLTPRTLTNGAAKAFALAGLVFFLARLATTTALFVGFDRAYDAQLEALGHIQPGSRVLVQAGVSCLDSWPRPRVDHLGSMAIVRRDAFVNDQFAMAGAQLLRVRYEGGFPYVRDPSQMVPPRHCRSYGESILETAVARFPRGGFDYLWLINFPRERWPQTPDVIPVWQGESGALYRAAGSATAASDTPNGNDARPTR